MPRGRRLTYPALGGTAAAVLVIALAAFIATRDSQPQEVQANAVGIFSADSGKLIGQVPVGASPESITAGDGSVWVGNAQDETVSRIDAKTRRLILSIPTGAVPEGLQSAAGGIWFAGGKGAGWIDPIFNRVDRHLAVTKPLTGASGTLKVALVGSRLWVAAAYGVTSFDARTQRPWRSITVVDGPSGVASGGGSVWISGSTDAKVTQIDSTGTLSHVS